MTKNYTPNIGELCHEGARRDAIHFAVAPVVAACTLRPGEHVGLLPGRRASNDACTVLIGIVDPFLPGPIYQGQTFWLMLYPNTVQDLHHVWVHPSFTPQLPPKKEPNNA